MSSADFRANASGPLNTLDEWDDDLKRRYPTLRDGSSPLASPKPHEEFRDYGQSVRPAVREFYRLNHVGQTLEFVQAKRAEFLPLNRKQMGVWEAMELLNSLTDDSDPDTELPQIEHCLQTAEAIRTDGRPDWFILAGLIHDLGKVLCLFGEPQWAVVGDTFPLGCRFSEKIVFSEFFADNPDSLIPEYQTECGIYEEGCGLDRVFLAWGHDEYLYHVVCDYLPDEALAMIRYHSFYPWHREGAYRHLMNADDHAMLPWVQAFNPYDLYTKSEIRPDVAALRPFYEELIAGYFPPKLRW